jgi:hypothetical protein
MPFVAVATKKHEYSLHGRRLYIVVIVEVNLLRTVTVLCLYAMVAVMISVRDILLSVQ